ncbi:MAG: TIGR01777 family oxidoreductase [Bacteroidia bacterium]|nr:TIGR01777 family oxidoreductase [Bacteroidia bacterium]
MNILIAGGTGFIGNYLVKSLTNEGHTVTLLTRSKRESGNRYVNYVQWDGKELPLAVRVAVYDGVINLTGESIAEKKWTEEYKKKLTESRIATTNACVEYINGCNLMPKFFLNASAVGIYGGDSSAETDEAAPAGNDFMGNLCKSWEDAAQKARCRSVQLRIGVVLGRGGGMIKEITPIYKMHIGGKFASGKQGMSWIHITDLIRAIHFIIENENISGPVNLSAPVWVSQAAFSKSLDKALGKWNPFFIPKFALDIVFGERSILFWGGQKAIPKKLLTAGFRFQFPEIEPALKEIYAQ